MALSSLSVDDLDAFLIEKGFSVEIVRAFQENDIDGSVFCEMTASQVREIAPKIGDQVKLKRLQDSEKSVSIVYNGLTVLLYLHREPSQTNLLRLLLL